MPYKHTCTAGSAGRGRGKGITARHHPWWQGHNPCLQTIMQALVVAPQGLSTQSRLGASFCSTDLQALHSGSTPSALLARLRNSLRSLSAWHALQSMWPASTDCAGVPSCGASTATAAAALVGCASVWLGAEAGAVVGGPATTAGAWTVLPNSASRAPVSFEPPSGTFAAAAGCGSVGLGAES